MFSGNASPVLVMKSLSGTIGQLNIMPKLRFLIHLKPDHVGVAIEDMKDNESVEGVYMDSGKKITVMSKASIPLGHKIALRDLKKGEKVIEYGEVIGITTQEIEAGNHVHVHNIRSLRWGN